MDSEEIVAPLPIEMITIKEEPKSPGNNAAEDFSGVPEINEGGTEVFHNPNFSAGHQIAQQKEKINRLNAAFMNIDHENDSTVKVEPENEYFEIQNLPLDIPRNTTSADTKVTIPVTHSFEFNEVIKTENSEAINESNLLYDVAYEDWKIKNEELDIKEDDLNKETRYGMARRKNATRETTSTLKAWLNEHKKNPYPTQGEKIMLAIIMKMTLTQVSTWFSNARRRLKKENKMTWKPRNRVEDDDNNNDDDDQDHKSTDGKYLLDSKDSGTATSEDGDRQPHLRLAPDTASEWTESRPDSGPDSPEIYERPPHPAFLPPRSSGSPPQISKSVPTKPRIWSLGSPGSTPATMYSTASSRLMAPLGSRLPPPGLHTAPYARPHDFYRSLFGPAAAQHLVASYAGPPDSFGDLSKDACRPAERHQDQPCDVPM